MLWNLALDPQHGPHKGGCGDCRGVITIDPVTGAITRNVEYYVLGHASRYVLPGAWRVGTVTKGQGIEATAFLNRDGSRVAILHRTPETLRSSWRSMAERFVVPLANGAVATLRWR